MKVYYGGSLDCRADPTRSQLVKSFLFVARSWKVLRGTLGSQMCYHGIFLIIDHDVILGGECPLDVAYLQKGKLATNYLDWVSEPLYALDPALQQRIVSAVP